MLEQKILRYTLSQSFKSLVDLVYGLFLII